MNEKQYRILIVEDDPVNIEVLRELLEQDYDLLIAERGSEAIRLMETGSPDVVLLDVMLPDLNGVELCKRFKSRRDLQHIPIIMVTTLEHQEDKIRALKAGANDYLNKPIDKEELYLKVKNHLLIRRQFIQIQNQNREINRYVELIVHDLKTPLGVIVGYSDLIEMTAQNESVKKYIEQVRISCRRMVKSINEMLNIQMIQSSSFNLNMAKFDLHARITALLPDWEVLAGKKKIEIRLCLVDNLPSAIGDTEKFKDVMENLIENAVKFSHPNTIVEVRAKKIAGGFVEIQVKDRGLGITEEDKKRVFSKFQKLSARPTAGETSTGLGLSIVKRLVELMGGEVGVRSKGRDKGSEFWFTLKS